MPKNLFDFFFVLSLMAPIVALLVGAFALAIPTRRPRWLTFERAWQGGARGSGRTDMRNGRGHAFRRPAAR